ncbi:alkaline phosphatase [Paenibacillus chitinolyticus]|uniref:alkaline phosphatase n=1 Tax=Paenibacillus chitinolyticus TaxID=79263 RepID=UPI00355878B5
MAKKMLGMLLTSALVCGSLGAGTGHAQSGRALPAEKKEVKNVILFITDGMSLSDVNLTRWVQGGKPLEMDAYFKGLVRTYASDSLTTDSAAGASAYATGHKVKSETVSISPDKVTMPFIDKPSEREAAKPLPTLLEAARLKGKGTGLVFTCELTDATPAVFASHAESRDNAHSIAEQMVYSGVDLVLGGGSGYLVPGDKEINRKDGEDLTKVLKANGYEYATSRIDLLSSQTNKIWGLFNEGALDADLDLDPQKQPTLAEMTTIAANKLSSNQNGFFLMVEASQIDWFGHDNDPVGIVTETQAFDRALKAAIDFAKKDGNTAVISVSDHATGGLNMTNYDTMKDLQPIFTKAKHTSYGLEGRINESNYKKMLEEEYGLSDLTKEEEEAVKKGLKDNLSPVIGGILGERAGVSFSTGDHTSEEVGLFAYHPNDFLPTDYAGSGVVENTDVGKYLQLILGLDLPALENKLFLPASDLEAKGAKVTVDKSDKENPVVVVTKGTKTIKLPVDKNIALTDGKTIKLSTPTLLIKNKVWVSSDAAALIQ